MRGHWEEGLSDKQKESHPHLPSSVPPAFLAGPVATASGCQSAWTTAGAQPRRLSVETRCPRVVSHRNATLPEPEWDTSLSPEWEKEWEPEWDTSLSPAVTFIYPVRQFVDAVPLRNRPSPPLPIWPYLGATWCPKGSLPVGSGLMERAQVFAFGFVFPVLF